MKIINDITFIRIQCAQNNNDNNDHNKTNNRLRLRPVCVMRRNVLRTAKPRAKIRWKKINKKKTPPLAAGRSPGDRFYIVCIVLIFYYRTCVKRRAREKRRGAVRG